MSAAKKLKKGAIYIYKNKIESQSNTACSVSKLKLRQCLWRPCLLRPLLLRPCMSTQCLSRPWLSRPWLSRPCLLRSCFSIHDQFDPIWFIFNKFDPVWTNLNKFDQVWTNLIHLDQIWSRYPCLNNMFQIFMSKLKIAPKCCKFSKVSDYDYDEKLFLRQWAKGGSQSKKNVTENLMLLL